MMRRLQLFLIAALVVLLAGCASGGKLVPAAEGVRVFERQFDTHPDRAPRPRTPRAPGRANNHLGRANRFGKATGLAGGGRRAHLAKAQGQLRLGGIHGQALAIGRVHGVLNHAGASQHLCDGFRKNGGPCGLKGRCPFF